MESPSNKVIRVLNQLFNIKLLIISSAFLLIGSSFLGWIDQPIKGWLKGYEIGLSDNFHPMLSYGILTIILGLFSFITLFKRLRWVSIILSLLGLMLFLNFFLSFALFDLKNILALYDLNQQANYIMKFNVYLPPNIGKDPTFIPSITLESIEERLLAALYFTTLGWYAAVLGSLLLSIVFIKSEVYKHSRKILFLFILFIVLYFVVMLPPYIAAEYHRNKGDNYLSVGMASKAIDEYEIARQFDPNLDQLMDFHINRGKAYSLLAREAEGDYYIYKAEELVMEKNFSMAILFLQQAQEAEPSIKGLSRKLISWAYIDYGLFLYQREMFSLPIEWWEKALTIDATQIQLYYFLCKAYYDINAYTESINTGLKFLSLSRDRLMNANINSNIADSYYKLKDYPMARHFYIKSLLLDRDRNIRAIMSLVGK